MSPEEILLKFVQDDEGRQWASKRDGWSPSSEPVCSWYGIICDPADHSTVTGIFLPQSDLSGTIPPELGRLTTLRSITLSQNRIQGHIPKSLAELGHLEALNLSDNKITGTIPPFSSSYLSSLNLGYNLLTGTLDDFIGVRHPYMTELDVMSNQLSGTIPESISLMTSLSDLSLSKNSFSGTIPSSLGNIDSLQFLYLDNNFLTGPISPAIAKIDSALSEIWFQGNLLSGTIPVTLSVIKKLANLYIDGNKFTGTVPKDLCKMNLNADFFVNVQEDTVHDQCDSIACPVGHVANDGVYPCVPCENRFFNPYLGRVGHCIDMNQREILEKLYKATDGENWLSNNWDVDDSFLCDFTGITCDGNNHVISISLKGMGLHGTIPEEIGFLRYLQHLDLSDNQLTGFLPSDLRWPPLDELDISGNYLRGIVPPMLCFKADINGNGNGGDYNCENIACPVGTYNPTGTRGENGEKCIPCKKGGLYLGSKDCLVAGMRSSSGIMENGKVILLIIITVCVAAYGLLTTRRRKREINLDFWTERVPETDDMIDDCRRTVNTENAIKSNNGRNTLKVTSNVGSREKTAPEDSIKTGTFAGGSDDELPRDSIVLQCQGYHDDSESSSSASSRSSSPEGSSRNSHRSKNTRSSTSKKARSSVHKTARSSSQENEKRMNKSFPSFPNSEEQQRGLIPRNASCDEVWLDVPKI